MLRKGLGPVQVQLISIGGIIGSGYFLGVGSTLAESGWTILLAYLLGGLIVWLVAMAMGELSVGMAREGGFVSQSSELFGRHWAAGVGWSYWLNWCVYIPSEMIAGGMILNQFCPTVSTLSWAVLFGICITVLNLINVKRFGQIESLLSVVKIAAMASFVVFAGFIWIRGVGVPPPISRQTANLPTAIIPGGISFLLTMVLVLVNFQGTELIALSAAETKDPEKNLPPVVRNVALRTIGLFVVPLTMLILIFPWNEAKVERSVFAEVFSRHGFEGLALGFELVIVLAALSCANSGLYGAARALFCLGKEGLAPQWTTRLNSQGIPSNAAWATIGLSWCVLPFYLFFEGSNFYIWLLSVSGFTGAICWIAITGCQIRLRKNNGSSKKLAYKMPGYPYLSWFSLALQTGCLGLLAFHPTLNTSLILGIPAFVVPVLYFWMKEKVQRSKGTLGSLAFK